MQFLFDVQRSIYAALSSEIAAHSTSRDITALLAVLPLGIVFGAAHAFTPGQSKSVLAAYVFCSGLKPSRALLTSFVLSVTHISSAMLHVLWWGLAELYRAIRARPHVHGESIAASFVAGPIPCPLALFVITVALSRGAPEAGLAFSVSMLWGVATILGVVAVVSAVARNAFVHLFDRHGMAIATISRGFDAIAGVVLTSIAVFELTR